MKKIIALILIAASLFCTAGIAETMLGGWAVPEDAALTEEVLDIFGKAVEGLVGSKFEPIALLGTQVVSGTNYCILCRVTPVVPDAQAHWTMVYVYAALDGSVELLGMEDLTLAIPEVIY